MTLIDYREFVPAGPNLILTRSVDRIIFLLVPPRHEGRFAIVTIRGAGCGGAAASGASEDGGACSLYKGRVNHPSKRWTDHAVRGIAGGNAWHERVTSAPAQVVWSCKIRSALSLFNRRGKVPRRRRRQPEGVAGESTKQAGAPPRAERRMYLACSW